MRYERPAIERRVELNSPVIKGVISPSFSPTWKRPQRADASDVPGGPPPTE